MKSWKICILMLAAFAFGMIFESFRTQVEVDNAVSDVVSMITDQCIDIHYFVIGGKTYECYIDKDI